MAIAASGGIRPHFRAVQEPPPIPRFDEGVMTTTNKVVTFALALIASVASFLMLPFNAAIFATLGSSLLASYVACNGNTEEGAQDGERPGWLQAAVNWIPVLGQAALHPVRQQGPRVEVGGGHNQHHVVVPVQRHQRDLPVRGVPVMHEQPHPLRHMPQQDQPPFRGALQQRVHVGRGHRDEQPPVMPMVQPQHQVPVVPVQQQQAQAFAAHQVLQHPPQQPQVRVPVGRGHLGQQQQ